MSGCRQCSIDFPACSGQHPVLAGMNKWEGGPVACRAAPGSPVQGLPLPEEVFVVSIEQEFKTTRHFVQSNNPAQLLSKCFVL